MNTLQNLLSEYGESHQNETNKTIHWLCVPAIFFSLVGLLYSVRLPAWIGGVQLNLAFIASFLLLIYYARLSATLWIGMLLFELLCLGGCALLETTPLPLWIFCTALFIFAWIGQFYGHHVEGKKPSFLKDLQFLLIGPAWLMSFLYKKAGISI